MNILLVADGRSPITKRWIQSLLALQHCVHLVSTYPCADIPGIESLTVLPVAFGSLAGGQVSSRPGRAPASGLRRWLRRFRSLAASGRYLLGPATLLFYGFKIRRLALDLKPDLVHALRIPFEGMLAAYIPHWIPLVVSIWGNDLTLHAQRNPVMRRRSQRTLERANGLMADAKRDIRLGREWGFAPDRPTLVVPGSGGIDLSELHRLRTEYDELPELFPAGVPLVINPRGFRPGSVRNDVFFQAIPLILQRKPNVRFVCPGMAGQAEALNWMQQLHLEGAVRLMPYLSQPELWDLFLRADVTVSVSAHDGTPNSLLEAMACGCFPVAGDIESLREWITPGVNGLLVDPDQPQALAEAVLLALDHPELRSAAAEMNLKIVSERAEVGTARAQVQVFYQRIAAMDPRRENKVD
jgi:glycosyltransferase involved in cell wall biosynthesis